MNVITYVNCGAVVCCRWFFSFWRDFLICFVFSQLL